MGLVQLSEGELNILKQNPLFTSFSEQDILQLLKSYGTISVYEKNMRLDTGNILGILLYGRACIRQLGKHNSVLDYIFPPRAFGLASIYLKNIRLSEIYALTPLRLLCFSRREVDFLLDTYPCFRTNFIYYLSTRVAFLTGKLEHLANTNAADRLFAYLQEHADESGCYDIPSMTGFASLLNISRASLYRAIGQLEEYGAIIRRGKQLILSSMPTE